MDPDISQQILTEVQRLRRSMRRSSIAAFVLLAIFVGVSICVMTWQGDPYAQASRAMRAGNYSRALQIVHRISAEHPENYYPHEYLGMIYLESGDTAKSEEEYSRAHALYPSETITKALQLTPKLLAIAYPRLVNREIGIWLAISCRRV